MVSFADVEDAFFFVSSAGYGEHSAVLNKESGRLYYRSELGDLDELSDAELDSGDWIDIPHKNELDLGQELVFQFVSDHLPDEYERVQVFFRSRGAYAKFKALLESKGLLQTWFDFENEREKQALRQWCLENDIAISG